MKHEDRAHRRFLDYRASGDPQALADVFDLAAQELLLVAHHLANPGVAPADLVQSTFLAAMERADRFDPTRPLMPWLCGILANVGRSHNRAAIRRVVDRAGHDGAFSREPIEAAHAREFRDALAAAITELPRRQREVLTLRLIHGLTPTEIAHALGEPVGTVKSWVHRGVQRLRQVLPPSFAAALALMIGSESALAHTRREVLDEATRLHQAGEVTITAAASITFVKLMTLAALALACVATAWLGRTGADDVSRPEPGGLTRTAALEDDESLPSLAAAAPTIRDTAARTTEPRLRIEVRHSDGAPGSGIAIWIEPRFGADPALRSIRAVTDLDGVLQVTGLAAGRYTVLPDRGVPRTVSLSTSSLTHRVDLQAGLTVHGVVTGPHGESISGARIWMSSATPGTPGMVAAMTDADGRYRLRDVPAQRAIAAIADGYPCGQLVPVAEIKSNDGTTERNIDLQLQDRATPVVVRVEDERGAPVPSAWVQLGNADAFSASTPSGTHALPAPQRAITDDQGRAVFLAPPRGAVRVWARTAGTQRATAVVPERPSDEVVLRLTPGATWTGRVIGPDAGVSTDDLWVECRTPSAGPATDVPPWWTVPLVYVSPGQPFRLRGVPPGAQLLHAAATDGGLVERAVTLEEGETVEWSPEVSARRRVNGRAIDADGLPLVGYRVVAFTADGLFSYVETDAAGRFQFEEPEQPLHVLWLHGPQDGYPGAMTRRRLTEETIQPVIIELPRHRRPSGYLRVRVLDDQDQPCERVLAVAAADGTMMSGATEDGFTTFGPLPPGDYYAAVSGDHGTALLNGPHTVRADELVDAGTARLERPGTIRVRLTTAPGVELPARVPLSILTLDGSYMVSYLVLEDDEAVSPPLPSGRYRCAIMAPVAAEQVEVEVHSEQQSVAELRAVPSRPTTIRLHHPELCRGTSLRLSWNRTGRAAWQRTMGRVLSPAYGAAEHTLTLSPGRYDLEVKSDEGWHGTATFDVPNDRDPPTVHIHLQ